MRTRAELEENHLKRYRWEQDQIAHMKVFDVCCTVCAHEDVCVHVDFYVYVNLG